MARILLVHPGPDFSVADVHRGWAKAFRAQGHEVMIYNTNERLTFYGRVMLEDPTKTTCGTCAQPGVRKAIENPLQVMQMAVKGLFESCFLFWPDIVFFVSGFYMQAAHLQVLRKRNMKIIMLHTESPYQDEEQMDRGQFADLNLVNDSCNIQAWRDLDVPAHYLPHSYDPDIHYPDANGLEKESDFTFIGTAFKSRQKFFHEMDLSGLRVAFGGNAWDKIHPEYQDILQYLRHHPDQCVDNTETARIYRISKTGINFYRRESEDAHVGEGWAMGPREVEMAACGLFFLRDPRGESDDVFGGNSSFAVPEVLPAFDGPEDASEKIKWWVKNDRLREKHAQWARERIMDRSFTKQSFRVAKWMEEAGCL